MDDKLIKKKTAKKAYRDRNKQKIREYNRTYHLENKDVLNEKSREWRVNNHNSVSEYNKSYYKKNKTIINSKYKEYYSENKEYFKEKSSTYRLDNRDSLLMKKKTYDSLPENYEKSRERNKKNWRAYLISGARASAKRRNIEFSINESDLSDPDGAFCPVFGTEFVIGRKSIVDQSATIDRIDNSLGYIPGNVQIISSLANRIKFTCESNLIRRIGLAVQNMERNLPYFICDFSPSTSSLRKRMVSMKKCSNKNKRNLEFNIEWFHFFLPDFCPCTGNAVNYNYDYSDWLNTPTIDRIDNSQGYIPGNVWVISLLANMTKSSATGSQIVTVADWMDSNS